MRRILTITITALALTPATASAAPSLSIAHARRASLTNDLSEWSEHEGVKAEVFACHRHNATHVDCVVGAWWMEGKHAVLTEVREYVTLSHGRLRVDLSESYEELQT